MLGKNYQHTLDSIKADRVFVSWWSAFRDPFVPVTLTDLMSLPFAFVMVIHKMTI